MKLVIALMIVAGLGYVAYAKVLRSAPRRICERVATACGTTLDAQSLDQCTDLFDQVKKAGGDLGRTAQCTSEATSCMEATGCVAGGLAKVGIGAAAQFAAGFHKGM